MRRVASAGLLLLALAAGCGSPSAAVPAARPASPPNAGAVAPAAAGPVELGQTFTYPDGLAVTVSKGSSFDPRPYYPSTRGITFTVKVSNGTGAAFAVSSLGNGPQITADGASPDLIVNPRDSKAGVASYESTVLPGKAFTYYSTVGVEDSSDVEVQAEWSREDGSAPVIFTGTG